MNTQYEHEGDYNCVVESSAGDRIERSAYIMVQGKGTQHLVFNGRAKKPITSITLSPEIYVGAAYREQ